MPSPITGCSVASTRRIAALLVALASVIGCDSSESKGTENMENQTVAQLEEGIDEKHPAAHYMLATKLFAQGRKDDAVFWFYLGQLRYRFHLSVNPKLDPSGDPALFAALSSSVGTPLNEYAFGDIPRLAATMDRVLAYDDSHDNGFTAKKGNEAQLATIRAGLKDLRAYIVDNEATIKQQRRENGLE